MGTLFGGASPIPGERGGIVLQQRPVSSRTAGDLVRVLPVLLLLLAAASRLAGAAAEVETFLVVISVTDQSGHRALGVGVSLIPWTGEGAALKGTTGTAGDAFFDKVPAGLYRLEIRADGYAKIAVSRFLVNRESLTDGAVRRRFRLKARSSEPSPARSG